MRARQSPGVRDWREETATDLRHSLKTVEELLPTISGELSDQQVRSVWYAYLFVEKSIAFIRVEIDEENPGKFVNTKLYSVPDERQALVFTLRKLTSGSEEFALGDFRRALTELRGARNYLRMLLRGKRKLKRGSARNLRTG